MSVFVNLIDLIGLALWLLVAIPVVAGLAFYAIRDKLRQSRCKHDRAVNETSACQAICADCGKDLGFIQNWRDQHRSAK